MPRAVGIDRIDDLANVVDAIEHHRKVAPKEVQGFMVSMGWMRKDGSTVKNEDEQLAMIGHYNQVGGICAGGAGGAQMVRVPTPMGFPAQFQAQVGNGASGAGSGAMVVCGPAGSGSANSTGIIVPPGQSTAGALIPFHPKPTMVLAYDGTTGDEVFLGYSRIDMTGEVVRKGFRKPLNEHGPKFLSAVLMVVGPKAYSGTKQKLLILPGKKGCDAYTILAMIERLLSWGPSFVLSLCCEPVLDVPTRIRKRHELCGSREVGLAPDFTCFPDAAYVPVWDDQGNVACVFKHGVDEPLDLQGVNSFEAFSQLKFENMHSEHRGGVTGLSEDQQEKVMPVSFPTSRRWTSTTALPVGAANRLPCRSKLRRPGMRQPRRPSRLP